MHSTEVDGWTWGPKNTKQPFYCPAWFLFFMLVLVSNFPYFLSFPWPLPHPVPLILPLFPFLGSQPKEATSHYRYLPQIRTGVMESSRFLPSPSPPTTTLPTTIISPRFLQWEKLIALNTDNWQALMIDRSGMGDMEAAACKVDLDTNPLSLSLSPSLSAALVCWVS